MSSSGRAMPGRGFEVTDSLLEIGEEEEQLRRTRAGDEGTRQQGVGETRGKGVGDVYTGLSIGKSVIGAGSFALPWVFRNQGLMGGTLTVLISVILTVRTMKQLIQMKNIVEQNTGKMNLSYVDVARAVLGDFGAYFVFTTQFLASIGCCSAFFAFIGSTLVGLSSQDGTWMHKHMADWTKVGFQRMMVVIVLPITFLRSSRFLRFTNTLGTLAVFLAVVATVIDGFSNSEGSWDAFRKQVEASRMWPTSFHDYAKSFGCVVFLFCAHFMMIPIERGMKRPDNFSSVLTVAFVPITVLNLIFGAVCFVFYGDSTQDIATNNLGAGQLLTIIKLVLCIGLLFSYPLCFIPGREIVEQVCIKSEAPAAAVCGGIIIRTASTELAPEAQQSWLNSEDESCDEDNKPIGVTVHGDEREQQEAMNPASPSAPWPSINAVSQPAKKKKPVFARWNQMLIRAILVALSYWFAQAKGFGVITNLVGGFAQGSLAFIVPPAIDLHLSYAVLSPFDVLGDVVVIVIGVVTAVLTSYEAIIQ